MKYNIERYKIREDKIEKLKNTFKLKYYVEELGYTMGYMSSVLNGKRDIPKYSAFAITKCIDKYAMISDYFKEIK